MAEGYLAEEYLTFCSRYLDRIETRFNWVRWVDDFSSECSLYQESSIFLNISQSVRKVFTFTLTQLELAQADRYVLFNCFIADPFIEELRTQIKRQLRSWTQLEAKVTKAINKEVIKWFAHYISLNSFAVYNYSILIYVTYNPLLYLYLYKS